MNIPRRNIDKLTIAIIVGYWIFVFAESLQNAYTLPLKFTDFAIRVLITKAIYLAALVELMRLSGDSLTSIGFDECNWTKQVTWGLGVGFLFFILTAIPNKGVVPRLSINQVEVPSMQHYFRDPENLASWILITVVGGGFIDEFMRIFILTRFEKVLGKVGLISALVIHSFLFGLGQLSNGIWSVTTGVTSGLLLGLLFIRRRKVIELICVRAISDVLTLLSTLFVMKQWK